jgi:quinol monooxygenase YgiN
VLLAVGDIYIQIPQRDAAIAVMRQTEQRVREQPGCLSFAFGELVGEPGHFSVVERWRDRPSLDAHYRSSAFAAYQSDITPLLVRDSELEVHVVDEHVRPFRADALDLRQDD